MSSFAVGGFLRSSGQSQGFASIHHPILSFVITMNERVTAAFPTNYPETMREEAGTIYPEKKWYE
jgi:hypothetical protein